MRLRRSLLVLPLAAFGAFWFWQLILPWPVLLPLIRPRSTAFMEMREREAKAADREFTLRYRWVPLDSISRNLRRAVIAAEDGRFEEHHGIDWQALAEELRYRPDASFSLLDARDRRELFDAIAYYVRNRGRVRGRSTITQQLAKNLYFRSDRSVLRKFEELIVAKRLEWFLSKDRILEVYLNIAEWGPGIFGAEAAARHYYNRSAFRLNMDQAVSLAATLPQPLTSNPKLRPGRLGWRKAIILRRMGMQGAVVTVPLEPPPAIQLDSFRPDTSRVRRDTTPPDTSRAHAVTARTMAFSRAAQLAVPSANNCSGSGVSGCMAVESAKTMSPSNGVKAGVMRRASAAAPMRAISASASLGSGASVTMAASVVFVPGVTGVRAANVLP
jgi:monofunctional biosynthetic peptidoglycan transglycosylase